ncbi:MAG: Crp/Fnr family transcriptional regulator [Betaproteobacteria bacterium]|nr:Crp/Fnr family transcriptional regulator [Betaproteobacteria bacterium]
MAPLHTDLELLKRGQWFGNLPEHLQRLIAERSTVRPYRKGEFLLREGESGKGMFALLEGRTRHLRSAGNASEVLLHVGEPGFWFGEYAAVCRQPSLGSAIADTACRALVLPAAEFERIVDEEPRYLRPFAMLMGERFALAYRFAAEVRGLKTEEWLRVRLAAVADLQRRDQPSRKPPTITLSQSELATMIGVSRQRLSVLLRRLQQRGLIEVGYRKIRLLG